MRKLKTGDIIKIKKLRKKLLIGDINKLGGDCDCCVDFNVREGNYEIIGNILKLKNPKKK